MTDGEGARPGCPSLTRPDSGAFQPPASTLASSKPARPEMPESLFILAVRRAATRFFISRLGGGATLRPITVSFADTTLFNTSSAQATVTPRRQRYQVTPLTQPTPLRRLRLSGIYLPAARHPPPFLFLPSPQPTLHQDHSFVVLFVQQTILPDLTTLPHLFRLP